MSLLDFTTILLTLSGLFGWLNHKFVPLPHSIGVLVMSVVTSGIFVFIDVVYPERHLFDALTSMMLQIDFSAVVMNGILAFLLFAGALHVNLERLHSRAVPVIILAGVGTLLSTAIVGDGTWQISRWIGQSISLPWALVFGALISPTDPVTVLSTLKTVNVPAALEVEMQGESLFNDGVSIVLFTILLKFATGSIEDTDAASVVEMLLVEAGGGLLLGVSTGYIAY